MNVIVFQGGIPVGCSQKRQSVTGLTTLQAHKTMANTAVDQVLFSGMTSPVSKVLYRNAAKAPPFQVVLHSLPVNSTLGLPAEGSQQRYLIPTGDNVTLSLTGSNQPEQSALLMKGNQFQLGNGEAANLKNNSTKAVSVLEVTIGQTGQVFSDNQTVALPPVTEVRPWGSFTVLADEQDFKLKQLLVNPDNRLSYQRHQKRQEHWFVIAGNPDVVLNDAQNSYVAGDYVHIPLHAWHRLVNPKGQTESVEIIELQLGEYFGEDDIERKDDDYGRN